MWYLSLLGQAPSVPFGTSHHLLCFKYSLFKSVMWQLLDTKKKLRDYIYHRGRTVSWLFLQNSFFSHCLKKSEDPCTQRNTWVPRDLLVIVISEGSWSFKSCDAELLVYFNFFFVSPPFFSSFFWMCYYVLHAHGDEFQHIWMSVSICFPCFFCFFSGFGK